MQLHIDRRTGEPGELEFEQLKSEGVRLLQELCCENWTDFNLHDPGITILEQCCYALTDLVYKTDFPTVDHLIDAQGRLEEQKTALHLPESVFPCRATTAGDYRKLILCMVPEIENVMIQTADNAVSRGLYRIMIRPGRLIDPDEESAMKQKVRQVYLQNRNLCEDLEDVIVMPEKECRVEGEVEIGEQKIPAEILAEIYHACELRIAGRVTARHLGDLLNKGLSWEEIFDGPLTGHASIGQDMQDGKMQNVGVSDLLSTIMGIPGVKSVKRISVIETNAGGEDRTIQSWGISSGYRLSIPDHAAYPAIILLQSGKSVSVSFQDFRTRYEELRYRRKALKDQLRDNTPLSHPPVGTNRAWGDYYSIQKQFPAVYGVNAYGVSTSAPVGRKARAAQLKAYLLFFDQIMANCGANLRNIRNLFSGDAPRQATYHSAVVENDSFPDLGMIYPENAAGMLESLTRQHDPLFDRRSRLLDYLLALYGEEFPQSQYKLFNVYPESHDPEMDVVRQKSDVLNHIVRLSRDRAAAFDYLRLSNDGENISELQRRIGLYLGINGRESSLIAPLWKLQLAAVKTPARSPARMSIHENRLAFVQIDERGEFQKLEEYAAELNEIFNAWSFSLPEELFRRGIDIESYRLLHRDAGVIDLMLATDADGVWLKLASFADAGAVQRKANLLRRLLIRLNKMCEGMFIVEHILLRDGNGGKRCGGEDKLSFRITVVFPAWTARTQNADFRAHAEQTVRDFCPAHIVVRFLWLDYESMRCFEILYVRWRRALAGYLDAEEAQKALLRMRDYFAEAETVSKGASE